MRTKFKESLPKSGDATSQTAKQEEAVKSNITGMSILVKINKSEDMIPMVGSP